MTTLTLAGCAHSDSTPANTGPSALGLDLQFTATPDVLQLDGQSTSQLKILARDSNGKPRSGVGFRVEIITSQGIVDIGRLSTKNVVTDGGGSATLTYTAPAGPPSGNSDPGNLGVVIQAIPSVSDGSSSGTDYSNALARTVKIRLAAQGIILPAAHAPVPRFTFSPSSPQVGDDVYFDATSSIASCVPNPSAPTDATKCTPEPGNIVSWTWDFGNGIAGNGPKLKTEFENAGTFVVKLTVVNDRGLSNSATQNVVISAQSPPKAAFAFSPSAPNINEPVFFDASASSTQDGRDIIDYAWNFGDGNGAHGNPVTHTLTNTGAYKVTLSTPDSAEGTATTTQSVTVGNGNKPVARFAFSPTAPKAGTAVNFDATLSTTSPDRSIVSYDWNYGDGAQELGSTNPRPSHVYGTAGSYVVTLRVTDSKGGVSDVFQSSVTVN